MNAGAAGSQKTLDSLGLESQLIVDCELPPFLVLGMELETSAGVTCSFNQSHLPRLQFYIGSRIGKIQRPAMAGVCIRGKPLSV